MKKRTINQLWENYRGMAVHPASPFLQVEMYQKTFYAGVASIVGEMVEMGNSSMTEDEGAPRPLLIDPELNKE